MARKAVSDFLNMERGGKQSTFVERLAYLQAAIDGLQATSRGLRPELGLMELTHAEIESLYSEPSVRMYRPEAVVAELADGVQVPALCFNLQIAPQPGESNDA